jgi:hypothetical protein
VLPRHRELPAQDPNRSQVQALASAWEPKFINKANAAHKRTQAPHIAVGSREDAGKQSLTAKCAHNLITMVSTHERKLGSHKLTASSCPTSCTNQYHVGEPRLA